MVDDEYQRSKDDGQATVVVVGEATTTAQMELDVASRNRRSSQEHRLALPAATTGSKHKNHILKENAVVLLDFIFELG